MDDLPDAPAVNAAVDTVDRDLTCEGCGYNLRGLALNGTCPECGSSVAAAWSGSLAQSEVVREAYDLNCPVLTAPGAAGERSLFAVDAPGVVVETVKPAEDGSGDVVVRLYESKRTATRCVLTTALPLAGASETDMLESAAGELAVEGGAIALDLRPFEIKTLRLRLGE